MAASGLRSSARPFLSDRTRSQIVSLLYTQTSLSTFAHHRVLVNQMRVSVPIGDKSSLAKEDTRVVPIYDLAINFARYSNYRRIIGREISQKYAQWNGQKRDDCKTCGLHHSSITIFQRKTRDILSWIMISRFICHRGEEKEEEEEGKNDAGDKTNVSGIPVSLLSLGDICMYVFTRSYARVTYLPPTSLHLPRRPAREVMVAWCNYSAWLAFCTPRVALTW